jgi:ribosomal protein S27AE
MAKICVQCEKKIGLFKTAIDGVYCSYACRDASRKDIADSTRRASEAKVAAEVAAREAATQAAEESRRAQADAALKRTCPKCGAGWDYAAGADGLDTGRCGKCGLTAEFRAIEKCPTCTGMSLIVEAKGARCPRCKFRRS